MARNGGKSRGAQPRQSGAGGGKRWPFFVGGLALGLLLAFGVYLLQILPTAMELRERARADQAACDTQAAEKPAKEAARPVKEGEKPLRFDFYTLLPQQEVVAPVSGNKTTVATPPPTPVPTPAAGAAPPPQPQAAGGGRFLLQAGSFRTRAEADRRRGELVLGGHSVSVQEVKLGGGETWFRVMIGPYADEAGMQAARQQLAGQKVDTLPIRLR